jgi:hypothetical protein
MLTRSVAYRDPDVYSGFTGFGFLYYGIHVDPLPRRLGLKPAR